MFVFIYSKATSLASVHRNNVKKKCSDIVMEGFSSSYLRLMYRQLDNIYYTSRALKEKELQKTPEFKRRILLVRKMRDQGLEICVLFTNWKGWFV